VLPEKIAPRIASHPLALSSATEITHYHENTLAHGHKASINTKEESVETGQELQTSDLSTNRLNCNVRLVSV
jgi:hypothetical protein